MIPMAGETDCRVLSFYKWHALCYPYSTNIITSLFIKLPRPDLSVFESNCHQRVPTYPPRAVEASHYSFLMLNVNQRSCKSQILQSSVWPDRKSNPFPPFQQKTPYPLHYWSPLIFFFKSLLYVLPQFAYFFRTGLAYKTWWNKLQATQDHCWNGFGGICLRELILLSREK